MSFLRQSNRISQRCLLIADDLTGGADSGAQFAKRGLSTLLISVKEGAQIDFSKYASNDVLVINTDSRRLTPDKASDLVSSLCREYDRNLFPVIYKKIDSTLRGNVGFEIDAILKETKIPICFMTPAYPDQNRTLINGILMVGGKPVALTEAARDAASPVQESHVQKLLQDQSRNNIGKIELSHVAASHEHLKKIVEEERNKGNKIIVFDVMTREDLRNVADVGFDLDKRPLFVGSAGLAEEVARKLSPSEPYIKNQTATKSSTHVFIISGSVSGVTHEQLRRLQRRDIISFELNKSFLTKEGPDFEAAKGELIPNISDALAKGHVVLRTCPERLISGDPKTSPIHLKIVKVIGEVALAVLKESHIGIRDTALVLTGGDTAFSVLNLLKIEGIEIGGEILKGIVIGRLIGGTWNGLKVITKAGAFGKEYALEKIINMLEMGSLSTKEEKNEGLD
jgi:uncharacterized protein YgbK (DUF1537 family)